LEYGKASLCYTLELRLFSNVSIDSESGPQSNMMVDSGPDPE